MHGITEIVRNIFFYHLGVTSLPQSTVVNGRYLFNIYSLILLAFLTGRALTGKFSILRIKPNRKPFHSITAPISTKKLKLSQYM